VAESCCKTPSSLCAVRDHPSNIFTRGCAAVVEESITEHVLVFAVLSLTLCLYQVCGLFVMSLLVRRINQRKAYDVIENVSSEIH
jgi:CD151 antigen